MECHRKKNVEITEFISVLISVLSNTLSKLFKCFLHIISMLNLFGSENSDTLKIIFMWQKYFIKSKTKNY